MVLRRGLRLTMGFTGQKASEKSPQKGFLEGGFQKVPRTPPLRVRPLSVCPISVHTARKNRKQNHCLVAWWTFWKRECEALGFFIETPKGGESPRVFFFGGGGNMES